MSNPSTENPTTREPDSTTPEKDSIRKSQEEFIGDMAEPSMDKSEYEKRQGQSKEEPSRTDKA